MENRPSSSRGRPPLPPARAPASTLDFHSRPVEELLILLRQPRYRAQVISVLCLEVLSVSKLLFPPKVSSEDANRVCNALALLQCIASCPTTRKQFITAQIPFYVYPFLKVKETTECFEFLRLYSLGVIDALVKEDDLYLPHAIHFLLKSEAFPLVLWCIQRGHEHSRTVATRVVHKILMQEEGLQYCCGNAGRIHFVGFVFSVMTNTLGERTSPLLLKYIVYCYLRLLEEPRIYDSWSQIPDFLPTKLRVPIFLNILHDDLESRRMLQKLLYIIQTMQ